MVYVLMAEGFEEIEAFTVVDILRRAQIKTELVSVDNKEYIKGAHGITVKSDVYMRSIQSDYEMIFLPGGYPGYENLLKNDAVKFLLTRANNENKHITAICAAPSILGKMGILKGKTACCFPSFENELIGANVVFDDVVCDNNIITSRGAGTAHKLAFKIVEILKGKDESEKLRNSMVY